MGMVGDGQEFYKQHHITDLSCGKPASHEAEQYCPTLIAAVGTGPPLPSLTGYSHRFTATTAVSSCSLKWLQESIFLRHQPMS